MQHDSEAPPAYDGGPGARQAAIALPGLAAVQICAAVRRRAVGQALDPDLHEDAIRLVRADLDLELRVRRGKRAPGLDTEGPYLLANLVLRAMDDVTAPAPALETLQELLDGLDRLMGGTAGGEELHRLERIFLRLATLTREQAGLPGETLFVGPFASTR